MLEEIAATISSVQREADEVAAFAEELAAAAEQLHATTESSRRPRSASPAISATSAGSPMTPGRSAKAATRRNRCACARS